MKCRVVSVILASSDSTPFARALVMGRRSWAPELESPAFTSMAQLRLSRP
jgi:hypothetical protein